jgi:hypothetical protein
MKLSNKEITLMEIAIEVAWQLEQNHKSIFTISRAEQRHRIIDHIADYIDLKKVPNEDLDEFINNLLYKFI